MKKWKKFGYFLFFSFRAVAQLTQYPQLAQPFRFHIPIGASPTEVSAKFEGHAMRWHRKVEGLLARPTTQHLRPKQRVLLHLEELETRALLSASSTATPEPTTAPANNEGAHPLLTVVHPHVSPLGSPAISGYTPQQIQQAYGVDSLLSGGTNGAGETIAIVDAYYDPNIVSDANTFNTQFNLPVFNNSSGGPTLTLVASGGGSPSGFSQDPTGGWPLETSLDVEWAHAIAPQANILLVEAPDASDSSMFGAVQYAAAQTGVVAVSMSWGDYEFSSENSYDSYFIPPSNNPGVTFVAASGDNSIPTYPATSPYVLAVGGTTLNTTTSPSGGTVYSSESGWSGSGGGPAQYEGEPSYQYNQSSIDNTYGFPNVEVYNYATGTYSYYYSRMAPDVSYNADPNSGFAVYDSIAAPDYGFGGGWGQVGGTSAGAPQWSALIALADQQRGALGQQPLDTNEVLNQLYNSLSNGDYANVFHDITTGSNGYPAGPGYDIVTGLGTPIANTLVPYLASTTIPLGQLPTIQGSGYGSAGTTGGFGSTTFTSFTTFSGYTAGAQSGAGLYTNSGSLTIPPASATANGLNGTASGTSAASAVPQTSTPLNPVANSLTFSISTVDAAGATLAGENNLLVKVPTPGSPSSAAGSTSLSPSTNALPAQGNNLFGASGWDGSPPTSHMSRLELPTPDVGQQSEEQPEKMQSLEDHSADDAILSDAGDSGDDLYLFDFTVPASSNEGEAGDAGDG